jgi:hypothetical protein
MIGGGTLTYMISNILWRRIAYGSRDVLPQRKRDAMAEVSSRDQVREVLPDDVKRPIITARVMPRENEFVATTLLLNDKESEHGTTDLKALLSLRVSPFDDCLRHGAPNNLCGAE